MSRKENYGQPQCVFFFTKHDGIYDHLKRSVKEDTEIALKCMVRVYSGSFYVCSSGVWIQGAAEKLSSIVSAQIEHPTCTFILLRENRQKCNHRIKKTKNTTLKDRQ